jgi:hypothetical protein
LVDQTRLEREYYDRKPDPGDFSQPVSCGTSGHRGSPLHGSFNEARIMAVAQAICEFRRGQGIDGPLFMGKDTHGVSGPAQRSAGPPYTTALRLAASRNHEALIFGVRFCVLKSTYTMPKRLPYPAIHSKLSIMLQWK